MPAWTAADLARHASTGDRLGLMPLFAASAARHGVPVALLLAVASRESQIGGFIERTGWTGDRGHGRGVMQIDDRAHPAYVAAHRDDDHRSNIDYGARYLAGLVRSFGGIGPPAVASYNAGERAVRNALAAGRTPDQATTGGDYATDVLARASVFARLAPGLTPPGIAATGLGAALVFALAVAVGAAAARHVRTPVEARRAAHPSRPFLLLA